MKYLYVAAVIACLYIAASLGIMGLNWIDIGIGLNPWLAFPGAAFAVYGVFYFLFLRLEYEREDRELYVNILNSFRD